MICSVSLTSGTVIAMFGILDETLKGMGYTEPAHDISVIVIVGLVLGVIGTVFYSAMVKTTKKYKLFSHISNT